MYRWESTQFLVLIPISLRSILAKYQTPVVLQTPDIRGYRQKKRLRVKCAESQIVANDASSLGRTVG